MITQKSGMVSEPQQYYHLARVPQLMIPSDVVVLPSQMSEKNATLLCNPLT